jgi:hypothetical protein
MAGWPRRSSDTWSRPDGGQDGIPPNGRVRGDQRSITERSEFANHGLITPNGLRRSSSTNPNGTTSNAPAADAKAARMNAAKLVVTKVDAKMRAMSARSLAKPAGLSLDDDEDADHHIELQLGGSHDVTNVWVSTIL